MQDSKKDTDVYSELLDSEGEGEGGMIWENGIETCILSCTNRITSLCPMQDTACLGLVHWDDPGGWHGEGCGREGSGWGNTCTPMAESCSCMAKQIKYCKVISLQLKKKKNTDCTENKKISKKPAF